MTIKIKIALCDDEPVMLEEAKQVLLAVLAELQLEDYQLDTYQSGKDLLKSNKKYDLLFLDIEMPDMDGFQLTEAIYQRGYEPLIIFLSSHHHLVFDSFRVKPFHFLKKPIDVDVFREVVARAVDEIISFEYVVIEDKEGVYIVDVRKIIHLESLGRETCVYLKDTYYIDIHTFKYWKNKLPARQFVSVHRQHIVNLAHVKKITEKWVITSDEMTLPVSKRRSKVVIAELHRFVREERGEMKI